MVASVSINDRRAPSPGSAIAVTFTSPELASARRWLRPMRPAPARPILNPATRSESPRGEVLAVRTLVRGRGSVSFGKNVLLDDDESGIGATDRIEHRVD